MLIKMSGKKLGFVAALALSACTVQPMAQVAAVDAGPGTSEGPKVASGNVPTQMAASLTKAGLDINNLPDLDSLPDDKLMAVMNTFTTSLGVTCTNCHVKDFTVDTPQKRDAIGMWNVFVRQLKRADGSPLYCDSCHQGKMDFLDRTNEMALGQFMDTNFVDGVKRDDGTMETCNSCHGTPFDPSFLDKWENPPDGGSDLGDGGTLADGAVDLGHTDLGAPDLSPDLSGGCVPSLNEVQTAGAGGASDEFIEIFNPCKTAFDFAGHRLIYRSAGGSTDTLLVELDGQTLAAGGFLVVGNTSYTGTAAVHYSVGLAAAGGGVALKDASGTVVDSVAWGTATNDCVQGKPVAAPASGKSAARTPDGSHAHANQSLDLTVGAPTPGAPN